MGILKRLTRPIGKDRAVSLESEQDSELRENFVSGVKEITAVLKGESPITDKTEIADIIVKRYAERRSARERNRTESLETERLIREQTEAGLTKIFERFRRK